MAKIESKLFGFTRSGDPVNEYILSNPGGLSVSVLDYGAIIKNIIVPARRGPVDVVLGHDTIQEYELDTATYCGAFVGPVRQPHRGRGLHPERQGHTSWRPTTAATTCTAALPARAIRSRRLGTLCCWRRTAPTARTASPET